MGQVWGLRLRPPFPSAASTRGLPPTPTPMKNSPFSTQSPRHMGNVPLEFQPAPVTPHPVPRTSGVAPPTHDGPSPSAPGPEPAAGGGAGASSGYLAPHSKATCRFWGAKHWNHACLGAPGRLLVLADGGRSDGPPTLLWVPTFLPAAPLPRLGCAAAGGEPRQAAGSPPCRGARGRSHQRPLCRPCSLPPTGACPGDASAGCLEPRPGPAGRKAEATLGCQAEPPGRGWGAHALPPRGAAQDPAPYLVQSVAAGAGVSERVQATLGLTKGTGPPPATPAARGAPRRPAPHGRERPASNRRTL